MRRLSLFAVVLALGASACSSSTAPTTTSLKDPPARCHPGCFPAGTMVATPEGPRPIETIRSGDRVTLVAPDGTLTSGPVDATFEACNRLVEVQTDVGTLLTTETQPLSLCTGGFRPAAELEAGDQIWRWEDGQRRTARVVVVEQTTRDVPVFNLVVGESAVFIANGFLARGKPPPDASTR